MQSLSIAFYDTFISWCAIDTDLQIIIGFKDIAGIFSFLLSLSLMLTLKCMVVIRSSNKGLDSIRSIRNLNYPVSQHMSSTKDSRSL